MIRWIVAPTLLIGLFGGILLGKTESSTSRQVVNKSSASTEGFTEIRKNLAK